jgi:TctA family transporter
MFAGLFVAMFVANVALRMLHVKLGITLWRLGDVGEFLLVLVAMVFFVAGVLAVEEAPE